MKYLFAFLFFCFVAMPVTASLAAETANTTTNVAIGTIAEIEGLVAIAKQDANGNETEDAQPVTPAIGDEIHLDDVIETGPESKALIVFIDDTELTLGENALFSVEEYIFDADTPDKNKGRFSVLRGAFIFATGLIGKRDNPDVKIETTYGSIGIRGTVVWGGVLDDQYNVFVQEGEVTFATDRGRVTLKPGQGTLVQNRRSIPSRAKAWGAPKIERAVKTVSLRNPAQARERVAQIKERHQAMRGNLRDRTRDQKLELQEERQEQQKQRREERQEKQLEYRPQHQERIEERPENIKEQLKEQRIENRPSKPGNVRPDMGGDSPQAIEKREKMHLRDRKPR